MKPRFKAILMGFEKYLNAKNYNKRYRKDILSRLTEYFEFIDEEKTNVDSSLPTEEFFFNLKSRINKNNGGDLSPTTINGYIGVLRNLNIYLQQSEKGSIDIRQSYLKNHPTKKLILTNAEVMELLDATPDNLYGERDRIALIVMYSCGLRIHELWLLDVGDILIDSQLLYVRKGKFGKNRYIPLPLKAIEAIKSYLRIVRPQLLSRSKSNPEAFLLSKCGSRLSKEAITGNIKNLAKLSANHEIRELQYGMHTFRHSISHSLYEAGLSIYELKLFLGHNSVETTQIYLSNITGKSLINNSQSTHKPTI